MKHRFVISLLTVLALLWQGLAVAAILPMLPAAPAATEMSAHCRMSMSHGDHALAKAAAEVPRKDCCKASGHCTCIAACSAAAALPASPGLPPSPADAGLSASLYVADLAAAPPPHPFRPPIDRSL